MLRVSLITLGDPNTMTGGYLYHRRVAHLARHHGADIRFQPLPDRPFPLPALWGRAVLRRAASGADVVLIDSIAAAGLAPWLARGTPPPALAAILHQPPGGIDGGAVRTALQAPLDRAVYRRCRLLIVASEHLAEHVQGIAAGITVIPPGRDVGAVAPTAESPDLRRGSGAALLFVGNWVERKGLLELLDAFVLLPRGIAHLHLVGDSERDPRYARRVRRRLQREALAGRVVVHGAVPKEAMAALYAAADVFVLPSVREPYGTAYGEAMAAGLPVVGWRAGNLTYLAQHDREGFLVPPGDIGALSDALRSLTLDEERRRRMGEAARARAQSLPTWEEVTGAVVRALRVLVS